MLTPLVGAGVDILHTSARRHYLPAFSGSALSLAGWVKKVTGRPAIGVGSVGLTTEFKLRRADGDVITAAPLDRLLEQFTAGEFDIAAIGRALLADLGWVNRLRDDTLDGHNAEPALAGLH